MEESNDNELDYTDILRRYVKLFVTDEQIEEGKKYYNEKYGNNAYVKIVNGMRLNEGLDGLYARGIFDDDWFDKYALSSYLALIKIIQHVLSGSIWSSDNYVDLAHISIVIEVDSKILGERLIKKIKEAAGVREDIFVKLPQDARKEAEAIYELMYASDKPKVTKS